MKRLAIVLLVLVACQTASGTSTDVELYEFGIDPSASRLVAGAIDLTVSNIGEYPHTLVITDAGGHVVSAGAVVAAGETAEMTVDLAPGEYTFTCRIVGQDDDGAVVDHFEEGMAAGINVS